MKNNAISRLSEDFAGAATPPADVDARFSDVRRNQHPVGGYTRAERHAAEGVTPAFLPVIRRQNTDRMSVSRLVMTTDSIGAAPKRATKGYSGRNFPFGWITMAEYTITP